MTDKHTDAVREAARMERELIHLRAQCTELRAAKRVLARDLQDRDLTIDRLRALRRTSSHVIEAPKGKGGHTRIATPVFLLSDWHIEEKVLPEQVSGLNRYNPHIAAQCIQAVSEAIVWFAEDKRFDQREAIIWLGGDLYSGHIHDELAESNFMTPVQAVLWLQPRLEALLRYVLDRCSFERIHVVCNDGNHGRLTKFTRYATRTANSLEWLLYQTLAARMRSEKRLVWHIALGEYEFLQVYGQWFAFAHGDNFKFSGGSGGVSVPLRRGLDDLRKYREVHHLSIGHFHAREDFADITVNGSMIGTMAWSLAHRFRPQVRQQSYFLVDSKRGKCVSAPIWLP